MCAYPVEQRVGEENRGWYHLAVALDFERSGIGSYSGGRRTVERFTRVVKEQPELWQHRKTLRHELAERALEVNVGTFLAYRVATMQAQGLVPNHEASASKLFGSELNQRLQLTGMHILGMSGMLRGASSRVAFDQAQFFLRSAANTVEAGTSEIQRNIMATRGLGLPRG